MSRLLTARLLCLLWKIILPRSCIFCQITAKLIKMKSMYRRLVKLIVFAWSRIFNPALFCFSEWLAYILNPKIYGYNVIMSAATNVCLMNVNFGCDLLRDRAMYMRGGLVYSYANKFCIISINVIKPYKKILHILLTMWLQRHATQLRYVGQIICPIFYHTQYFL